MTTKFTTTRAKSFPRGTPLLQLTAGALLGILLATAASGQGLTLTPQYSVTGGAVSVVSIAELTPNWFVTAVRDGGGRLDVIVWNNTGTAFVRTGRQISDKVGNVSVAALNPSTVVTAIIDSTGNLRLISWDVSPTGFIQKGRSYFTGISATTVSIAAVDSGRVATAITSGGNLNVFSFDVEPGGFISWVGRTSGGAVSQAAIAALSSTQVVTAARNSTGNIEITAWKVSGNGSITQQGNATAGIVKQLSIAYWQSTTMATALINAAGNLDLVAWNVDLSGNVTPAAIGTVGAASEVALFTVGEGPWPFTAVRAGSGDLSVGLWESSGGTTLTEAGSYDTTAPVSAVAAAGLVTAARGYKGRLEIQAWSVQPRRPAGSLGAKLTSGGRARTDCRARKRRGRRAASDRPRPAGG